MRTFDWIGIAGKLLVMKLPRLGIIALAATRSNFTSVMISPQCRRSCDGQIANI